MASDVVTVSKEAWEKGKKALDQVKGKAGKAASGMAKQAKENAPLLVGAGAGLGMYLLLGDSLVSEKPGKGIETFNKNKYLLALLFVAAGWYFYKKKGKIWGLALIAVGAVWAAKVYKDEEAKKAASGSTAGPDGVSSADGEWVTLADGSQLFITRGFRGAEALGSGAQRWDAAERAAEGVYGRAA